MDSSITGQIIAIIALIFLSAYFSATETAFTSVNKIRIKNMANEGNKKAEKVLVLSDKYDKLLTTILVGNNIVNITMTAIATVMFVSLYREYGATIATIVITVVVLIFGEITPKNIAKEKAESIRLKGSDIHHLLKNETSRLLRKMEAQRKELKEAEGAEEYRRKGDLLTANLYRISRGDEVALCTDWEAEGMPEIAIPLDIRLSPSANAQRYYKLYTKSKTAREILSEQIQKAEEELAYLETIATFLDTAESTEDLDGIRAELQKGGYLRADSAKNNANRGKKPKNPTLKTFITPGGYRLLVGVNNLQNEYLTFTVADKSDLWFHVKGMAGAHVVMCCGEDEPGEKDYTFAAIVAAHYSRAKGKGTAVDYTRVRELKRVKGGRPGFVIYHTNYSAYVNPDDFYSMIEETPQNG